MKEKFYSTKKFNKIIKIDQILDCSAVFSQKKGSFSNYPTACRISVQRSNFSAILVC